MLPVIEMGEKIKTLRKKRGITQEQFANYLNVSFQAVSKWERDESYPDITMIPRIAAFFDTSTDELLCTGKFKIEAEIEDYFSRKAEFDRLGETEKALELMREANEKYPGNFKIMKGLMDAISWNDNKRNEEERRIDNLEIIDIAEKIRNECTDDSIRKDVLQILCFAYKDIGDRETALDLIQTQLNSFYVSREVMLEHILEGDEFAKQLKSNISVFFDAVLSCMCRLSNTLTYEEKVKLCEKAIEINKTMYPNEIYSQTIFDLYHAVAREHIRNNSFEKALEYLRKEAELTVRSDREWRPSPDTVTMKNSVGNYSYWLLKRLEDEFYNPIRETEEFKAIIKNLKQYARDDI